MKNKNYLSFSLIVLFILFIVGCTTTPTEVKYTITYETDGGTIIKSEEVFEGDYIPCPEEPTKEGFLFLGWYMEETYETAVDFNQTVTEDLTIYAKWRDLSIVQINTITYILNGSINSELNPETFTYSDLPLILNEPTLNGKHFVGWFIDGKEIDSIPKNYEYDKDITLEARFEDIYTINYYGFGSDTVTNPTEYYPSSGIINLNIPQIAGYTFLGWTLNSKVVTAIPEDTVGNINLKTEYVANTYNITYELDGGTNAKSNPSSYTIDDDAIKLRQPLKEGYIFIGWKLDGEIITSLDTSLIKDVVLYAVWEVEPIYHNIMYILNGGTVDGDYQIKYQEGVGLTLPNVNKVGYTFLGWNTENKETTTYLKEISSDAKEDYTLYAIFRKNVVISNINYELYDGSFEGEVPTSYEEGTTVILPTPIRSGYNFLGWYLNAEFSGENIDSITETMTGNITLHAKWESNIPTYTVTYNLNGGTFKKNNPYSSRDDMVNAFLDDINAYYGTSMTLDTFFDASYNITPLNNFFNSDNYKAKWAWLKIYLVACAKEVNYDGLSQLENEQDTYFNTYLRANLNSFLSMSYRSDWPKSMDFTNTQLANGYVDYLPGDSIEIVYKFTADTETFTLPEVVRNEYTFIGWFDQNGNKVTEITKGTTNNVILNAKFESIYQLYTITYMTNGGTLPTDTVYEFTEKDIVVLNNPTKVGYRFIGWYTTSNFSGEIVYGIVDGTTENITLYAKFEVINYRIIYHDDNGSHNNVETYNIESNDIVLMDATKQGYKFLGWYNESGIKVEVIKKGTTEHIELFAKYETIVDDTIKYTVTYINESNEVMRTETVSHGSYVSEILLGTYEGLQLAWYKDDELYNFDEKLTSDLTLYAKWRVIDDIYNSIFYDKVLKANINIVREFDTDMGKISIVWATSNAEAINTASGLVSLDYEEKEVTITGTFKLNSTRFTVIRTYVVEKLNFRDLSTGPKPVFGYLYSNVGTMKTPEVVLDTIDVINYGFARVTSDGLVGIEELKYINKVAELRKEGIRVLLCIGGYGTACKEFSDASFTAEGRSKLAASILSIVQQYHFDGVDIDWEYPGYQTGRDVSIDRPNFTLLMAEIKRQLKEANPEYLVTAALPGGKYGYTRYEIGKLNSILDYFHLMTYDLQETARATHHTGLYTGSYTPHGSVEQTVNTFVSNGASKDKLIVGLAFYGRRFNVNSSSSGIGSTNNLSSASAITYTSIYNDYLIPIKNGSTTIARYWDDKTQAPYIYDKTTKVWISYDDPESIGYKCEYVKSQNLGGVMFWDYGEDQTFQLTQAIYDSLRK